MTGLPDIRVAALPDVRMSAPDLSTTKLTEAGSNWLAAMRRGDFSCAWSISDMVLAQRLTEGTRGHLPRHQQWVWDGRPLAGERVLVRCYHGLGDTIQFARFLPQLVRLARAVVVWAPTPLLPLLRTLDGCFELLPMHDGAPAVEHDVDIEIMELPHALRVTFDSLPAAVPYFAVPAAERFTGAFSVGLVARAGDWDAERSIEADALVDAVRKPQLFNLQLEQPIARMRDISTPDVLTLAARLQALDLVISVDTMVAHLAGALAVPTWTLLKADADWRWMEGRSD
ncbi:MAG TPA: hypothetical protein VFG86_05085, partial [Chloroflexota bacterium]|nr:hypothetical protein [Chloroflexota bacterium]